MPDVGHASLGVSTAEGSMALTELDRARAHLKGCQDNLYRHRRVRSRWQIVFERHVLEALDYLWQAQCREVFEDHNDGWFETASCARLVNNVDWEASRIASHNFRGIVAGVIVQRENIRE